MIATQRQQPRSSNQLATGRLLNDLKGLMVTLWED
jgi:hypothetical protein